MVLADVSFISFCAHWHVKVAKRALIVFSVHRQSQWMSVRVFEVDFQAALDISKLWRRSQQKYQADCEQLACLAKFKSLLALSCCGWDAHVF